jgi:nitrite reductase (NO-forming)
MTEPTPIRLSELPEESGSENAVLASTTRRTFLARASTLSLALPAAFAACTPGTTQRQDTTSGNGSNGNRGQGGPAAHNSDSRLDTAVLKGRPHNGKTTVPANAPTDIPFHRYAPELPPLLQDGRVQLHWHAREAPVRISDDTVVAAWTFEGDTPGPIVHCRVGDTVEFTLTNEVDVPHSMDFHAAQINPKEAFRSVTKGQSVTYSYKPKYAGAFMYHCGTSPVLMHIGSGMYGAIVVSPREPLPQAREFVLVQSELYLAAAGAGARSFDYQKMLSTLPDLVVFNGRPDQYIHAPLHAKVGERVRFWVVNAGPTHSCNFHVVGDQFDTVYLGAPPATAIRGVQTWGVAPGGGMCFELTCDIPGEFPFVNHGFGHGQKGGIGFLVVE